MSRSPLSPVGKRLKTMEETDESDEDDLRNMARAYEAHLIDERYFGLRTLDDEDGNDDDVSVSDDEDAHADDNNDCDEDEEDENDDGNDDHDEGEDNAEDESEPTAQRRTSRANREPRIHGEIIINPSFRVIRLINGDRRRNNGAANDSDDSDDSDDTDDSDNSNISYDDDEEDRISMSSWVEESDDFIDIFSDDDEIDHCSPERYLKYDPTPETQYPKPEWTTIKELRARRCGLASSKSITKSTHTSWYERYTNNSLWMIQRLNKTKSLKAHRSCVNTIDFSSDGSLLSSGGDDHKICIWDWQLNKLKTKLYSGHTDNVYNLQFCNSNNDVISSSRDGSLRITDILTGRTEVLLKQSGEIKDFSFLTPGTLVTCGTNSCVNLIDLRTRETNKLFLVRTPKNNRTCELNSINTHPLDNHKIVVAGASPYVFLYDLRRGDLSESENKPTYCLDAFEDTTNIVTSTAFNSIGDKLLISYSEDDLIVCQTDTFQVTRRFKGHINRKTIKECTWFGDNFVMSGSDDGHIYGWDLESAHIVCFLKADERKIVNCLCKHPTLPVLASSGFDHDVKIWEPTADTWPQTLKGIKPQICKNTMKKMRNIDRNFIQVMEGESDMDL